ncbi:hypothetical protein QQF64_011776 [Cirrhinus molitorella]|uniref:UDP-glucuronosyltransferase n=1 Tax=Cirrhinus molitorella TaxID=172907 RepID=A0ABR3LVW7_9TELE
MPNVIYIGGFQCKPAKALPHDLETFMQSSGEHGVIIMSLGSFISNLPDEITVEIAAAFARLPQKVIWRYSGKRPSTLGNNTLLVDWMPQNDLLGQPKTKVFIAHGGTNGFKRLCIMVFQWLEFHSFLTSMTIFFVYKRGEEPR